MPARLPGAHSLVALLAAVAMALGAPATAGPLEPDCALDGVDDRCEAWSALIDDPDGAAPSQFPADLALSPDGGVAFVAIKEVAGSGFDATSRWAVEARDTATGELRWSFRDPGPPGAYDFPAAVAASPDGRRVYVSGSRRSSFSEPDGRLHTLALDAASGEPLWTSTYDGPGKGTDNARAVVVAPDGSEVYVAAISGPGVNLDYAALAYDAETGEERWVTRWSGLGSGGTDSPFDAAITPDGRTLLMTGWTAGHGEFDVDFGTVAVRTAGPSRGAVAWEARYDGVGARAPDRANAVAVSPDGSAVYVTGLSGEDRDGPPFEVDYRYATVAYDAATGAELWEARRGWDGTEFNETAAVEVSPDGGTVVVTGQSTGGADTDIATVAYDAATGAERWALRHGLDRHDLELGRDLVVTADTVHVAGLATSSLTSNLFLGQGQLGDQVVAAYALEDGTPRWTARLNATRIGFSDAVEAALAGDRLVVLGESSDNVSADQDVYDGVLTAYDVLPSP